MQALSGRTRESGKRPRLTVGTTGREMLGAHSQHRFRSPHARPSQRLAPFPSFRHSHPSAIPAPRPSFLRPLRHSCGGRNPRDRPTVRRTSIRHSHPSAIPAPPPRHSCAPSVIPAEAGIHATAQPCDEPPSAIPILPSFLRPLRHSCGGRNPCDRPTVRRASIRHSHPSAIPAPPPSFLRRQESTRPPNRATSLHPPFPSFRHSCAPSVIPAPPPSFLRRQESMRPPNRATSLHPPFPSFRHSCAPSVIPAPPSVIPAPPSVIPAPPSVIPAPPPPFLRPLRHSCGGRNPCDHPTVRRASIRPTAHQSPQRAARDRAPSNTGSALDPHRSHGFLPPQE